MSEEKNPLDLFRATEDFLERRRNHSIYAESTDYAIRFCQAVVAKYAMYDNRNQWTAALVRSGSGSVYLDILRDIESFRKSTLGKNMTYLHAVQECQYRMARHLSLFDWRETLRQEHLKSGQHILHLPWVTGSVNDTIISACNELRIPHQYDWYFRLEICVNDVWGLVDSSCSDKMIDIYFFPRSEQGYTNSVA